MGERIMSAMSERHYDMAPVEPSRPCTIGEWHGLVEAAAVAISKKSEQWDYYYRAADAALRAALPDRAPVDGHGA
jgi:hypothetical protein